jgi:hypothetical protein
VEAVLGGAELVAAKADSAAALLCQLSFFKEGWGDHIFGNLGNEMDVRFVEQMIAALEDLTDPDLSAQIRQATPRL